ncbi:MAG: ABC transporter permease [Deltaproteobacteria bacterium]|nr:ABC transporter permease [Deltaproteobacteria bacterium]
MDDFLLAWRNIGRNTRRSVLTILAIVFASSLLVFMLSFQFGAYREMINSSVRLSTGHLQIQQKGYQDKPAVRKVIKNPKKLLRMVTSIDGVEAAGIRSESFALAAGPKKSRGIMVSGVTPQDETRISSLPRQIIRGRYLQTGDSGVAVIGVLAAKRLGIDIGGECTLLGQGRDGSVAAALVKIGGIYRTGIDEFDRTTMQIPFTDFDSAFSMEGGAHRLVITAYQLADTDRIAEIIKGTPETAGLAVLTWDQLTPGLKQSIELDLMGGIIMYAILITVVAFSILNTFFMAIFERTREFGVLMSIGTKPLRLVKLMLLESMTMTAIGILTGVTLGITVTLFFSRFGISLGESSEMMAQYGIADRIYPHLSILSVTVGPAIITVVAFMTALIPALKIPRMRPVEAMRAC